MRAIERSEILGLGDYEMVRPHFRPRVIAEKKPRRVELGEHIAAVFENRDSVLLQIQEMLRTERITAEPAIVHEIATYNELIPAAGQLSVTMFVQIPDRALRDRLLAEWAGLEDALGKSFTPEAAAAVKIDASGLSSDLHASAAYRANLISVMAQRAVAKALA